MESNGVDSTIAENAFPIRARSDQNYEERKRGPEDGRHTRSYVESLSRDTAAAWGKIKITPASSSLPLSLSRSLFLTLFVHFFADGLSIHIVGRFYCST